MNHTPGPWTARRTAGEHGWNIGGESSDVAHVWNRSSNSEADAFLIAAAHDLLEALKEWADDPVPCASATSRNAGENGNCDCWACERTRKAQSVARKAEGRAE